MLQLDYSLFHFINQTLANPVLDTVAPICRERNTWIVLYIFLLILLIYKFRLKSWVIVIGSVLAVSISDYSSSSIIKPLVKRVRPCNDPEIKESARLLINCGSGYSFPSSHAANHFALAAFLSLSFFKRHRYIIIALFLWAGSIAFSQVYVGVHYPFDVTAGGIWGIFLAWIIYIIFRRFKPELISLHL